MTGVIYARYSEGPRQTDQSIEGQVDDCRAYARNKGIDIVEIYADRHVSGKSVDGRNEFKRMMHDADQHKFDCIIVWKVDRFGRSREDIAVNKIRLKKAGVLIMYAKEAVPDGPEGILLESLLEGLAEYYSADLRQKVIRGHSESAKKGKWTAGRLPIGYKKDNDQRIILDPKAADCVRGIFRMCISGHSLKDMQQYLLECGIASRGGTVPSKSVVERILRNEKYTGKFSFRDIEIPAPIIIDRATFDEAQRHFHTGRNNAAGRAVVSYLLSGKCYCAYCGSLLVGECGTGKSGRMYHYYKCANAKRGKKCALKAIPQKKLENLVVEHTIADVLTDDLIDMLVDKIMEIQKKRQDEDPTIILKKRLEDNRKRQEALATAIENGGARVLVQRLATLEAEENELLVQISRNEIKHPVIPAELVRGWLLSFKAGDKDDPEFRKKLLHTFVSNVIVKNDSVTIFYNIEKEPNSRCSNTALLVDPRGLEPRTDRL